MAGSSSPQHAQNQGPSGDGAERSGRPGPNASSAPAGPPPATGPGKAPQGAGDPGPRVALRNWRISTRLVALLTLPVVAATTLGAVRINQSMDDIEQLDNMKLLTAMTKQATELAAKLQEERDESAGVLAHGSRVADIKGQRDATDRALTTFVDASEKIDASSKNGNLQGVRDNLVGLVSDLGSLAKIRKSAYTAEGNSMQTVEGYHRLISRLLDLSQDMAEATSNPEMIQRTRALAAFSSAKEYASMQRAVLAAALPTSNTSYGNLSDNDRTYGEMALESQDSQIAIFRSIYGDEGAEELLRTIEQGNTTIEQADTYATRAFASKTGLQSLEKRSYRDWLDASTTKIRQMANIERTLLEDMEQKARELRAESERDAIISGALILLVLGISLVGAFIVARSMIRSLRRLQETATKVASDRLPELVKQLSEADPQDVDTSVESVGVHSRDEIGQVAAAFDDVHREAVRLAAEQALLRGNVNAMFTNLSRRSQGLIQRQLSLISELESREADPDQLSSLFKLDHLATRMRRNGENLLVLAGEEPGRRWTRPVPLVDVLRAAASEVEQYERIELASVPTTEVAGRVVNDLVHLLAELLENATSFSSPQTKVKVTGHALPDGRVLIEIHDTGIGLSPEDLAAINERLASPPTVDVSVSRRMGLFVVGRLSQRHGIRIQLRPSDSGGTTALVMLPVDVAQGGKKPQPKPGQGMGGSGGPAAAQAAAGAAAARRQSGALGGGQGAPGGALGGAPAGAGGRLGAGQGPRAALPGVGQDGRPGAPGGARGPQQGQQGRPPAGAGAGAFGQGPGAPQGLQSAGTGGFDGQGRDAFGGASRGPVPPQRTGEDAEQGGGRRARRPQLPGSAPRGGPRAELPGGNPQPRVTGWGDENAQPQVPRSPLDGPRGHDEPDAAATSQLPRPDDRQGPGSTAEIPAVPRMDERQGSSADFARSGADGSQHTGQFAGPATNGRQDTGRYERPADRQDTGQYALPGTPERQDTGQYQRPGADGPQDTGQYQRPGAGGPQDTGQFPAPARQQDDFLRPDVFGAPGGQNAPASPDRFAAQPYDNGSTGQFPAAGQDGSGTGQYALPGRQDASATGQFERPQGGGYGGRQEPEALPPATSAGDGRTPLYDTLETNWFHGGAQGGQTPAEQQPQAPQSPAPQSSGPQSSGPQRPGSAAWRTSPNDELVRQAERVRQPAAGGVTTSGLPRRVPRANLVPGTAQQQQHQAGPQVSRAPDDVRGRLTNLRRGIAQGRQAGNGQTGSHQSPTHQQER